MNTKPDPKMPKMSRTKEKQLKRLNKQMRPLGKAAPVPQFIHEHAAQNVIRMGSKTKVIQVTRDPGKSVLRERIIEELRAKLARNPANARLAEALAALPPQDTWPRLTTINLKEKK